MYWKNLFNVGYVVKTVNNGAEAIELAKVEGFGLVMCDLDMPDITGFDVLKVLNELDKVPKIGIVTGCAEKLTSIEATALKVDFIINKPFELLELTSHLNALFDGV